MANKIKLCIGGQDYYINTDDDENYIRAISNELEGKITALTRQNPYLSATMAAVLVALDYCDQSKKALRQIERLNDDVKERDERSACSYLEADEARREIERLNRENIRLRNRLANK
jgi:cell division protein ZapA (FtsZ GTPase activity inhibitor)